MSIKDVETISHLSPLQAGLLSGYSSDASAETACSQLSFALHGALNVSLFEKAWQQAIERHMILRTAFIWKRLSKPQQVVFKQITNWFGEHDWRGLPGEPERRLEEFLLADRQSGFDASRPPLFRLALCRLSEDDYHFVWSYHPILLDDFSLGLILKDVFALYERYSRGEVADSTGDSNDSRAARSYQNYIRWLKQQDFTGCEEFREQALDDSDAPAVLAIERPAAAPQDKSEEYEGVELSLSPDAGAALNRLASEHGISIEALLQAAWALILSRYNRDRDVAFGITLSFRPSELSGAELISGALTATLPVRLQINSGASVISWLKEMQATWAKLSRYRHALPPQLNGCSRAPGVGAPLATRIAFEDHSPERFLRQWEGHLEISDVRRFGREYFPLTLTALREPELRLRLTYDRSRFEEPDIIRMLERCRNLLEAFTRDPYEKLSGLSMLGQEELHRLLVTFNDTSTDYPKDKCVHQVFEQQAELSPDAVAVRLEDEALTYSELNARANQLAHYLRLLGVGPEVTVALCMERSLAMIVGLLGILKAGGAYAPVDPAYPLERKLLILEDAQSPVVLTQESIIDELPALSPYTICLDSDWSTIEAQPAANPVNRTGPDNLAYVMYTSGSTGKPKGIGVVHKAVVRLVKQTNYVSLGPEEVILQMAPISFDASTFEIWGSLLNGGRLVLMSGRQASLEDLTEAIRKHRVSTMWLTAGLFHQVVNRQLRGLKGVKQLLAGGDVLSAAHVRTVVESVEGCKLINGYGPTENTTFTCCHQVREGEEAGGSVPIGAPISNTRVYVSGMDLEIAGVGVIGELYAAGDGLARGYMNRPDLTAEKFMPNPYGRDGGERLYRTGDLARYLSDGAIEFLGREDNQVKVSGYRIELAEIEAYIKKHPSIQDAAVIVREHAPGDKRLIAYLIAAEDSPVAPDMVRNYLKNLVPDYMLPHYFILLDSLPLTANGKLDRRALPSPEAIAQGEDKTLLLPRTSVEEMLVAIWQEVLKVEKLSIDDDFFDLGGHSLLATQVMSRVRAELQVDLPLRVLFESPTVIGLAGHVESALRSEAHDQAPPITRVSRDGFLPLSFAQQRLWFLNQMLPDSPYYNVPATVHLKGELDLKTFERILTEIVRRHEVLRTTFSKIDGQPTQVIGPALPLSLPLVDLAEVPEGDRKDRAQLIASEIANLPFNLEQGPLLRPLMIRLDEDEHIAVLILHHIVCDNWTTGLIVKEVSVLYEAFTAGRPSPLPEPEIQYADFAFWQRRWLQGEVLEAQLDYWKKQLDGAPRLLQLPTDRPRPAVQTFRGAHQAFTLSAELTESVKSLSRQSGVTLYMTLLAAYKALLFRYTGQTKVVVGSPIANRNRVETEPLIGFFVNMMALSTDLSGDITFVELLGRVREVMLGAYVHQDLPFEKLVDELHLERDLSHTPIVQTVLVLQNAPAEALQIPGLSLRPMELHSTTSMFDLILGMVDTPGGLRGLAVYNTDLFDSATTTRLLDSYVALLKEVTAYPDWRLIDIPLPGYQEQSFYEGDSVLENRYGIEQFNF